MHPIGRAVFITMNTLFLVETSLIEFLEKKHIEVKYNIHVSIIYRFRDTPLLL